MQWVAETTDWDHGEYEEPAARPPTRRTKRRLNFDGHGQMAPNGGYQAAKRKLLFVPFFSF